MLGYHESDIDSMDPELLSQLPLQSDMEHMPDMLISSSNLDVDATENDDMIIKSRVSHVIHHDNKLDLRNVSDDTEDTDLDVAAKPLDVDGQNASSRAWYYKPSNWLKLNVIFFLLALLIAGLSQPRMLWNLVEMLLFWMENHIVRGSFVFISLYIVCDLLMLPCLVLIMGAGFVYCNVLHSMWKGLCLSTFIVLISELIGSTIAFLTARYLLRKNIKQMAAKYPKFVLIDAAVKKNGFRVTLLFRMSPVTPYNLLNYFMGLTSVRLMDYTAASIGIVPNFFVCCLIGGSLHHIYQLSQIDITDNIPLLVGTCLGAVFVVVLVIYATRFIKRELAKISLQLKQEEEILSSSDNDEHHPLTEQDHHHHKYMNDPQISIDDIDIVSIELVSNDNDISEPMPLHARVQYK
eukprot:118122_1